MLKESDINNSNAADSIRMDQSSLPFLERVQLKVNEFKSRRNIKGLRQFQDEVGNIPVFIDQLPEPAGTPEKPLNKEELFSQLSETLYQSGYTKEEINKLHSVYEFADNKFVSTPGREKRKSGDDYITHSLWMAVFLAKNGITDMDVQMATILHDVHEDTETTLEEIEIISNKKTAELVDIVSKIKTENIFGDEISPQSIKDQDQKATKEKILEAIEKGPRAISIKAGDVIHNQLTSKYVKGNTRIGKGNLALEFYEPLVRQLGYNHFAESIGDYALRSTKRKRYEKIKNIKEAADSTQLPQLQKLIESWVEFETHEGDDLRAEVIEIGSPSIYQLHKSLEGKRASKSNLKCTPSIKITCASETELFKWGRFLNKKYQSQITDNNINNNLNSLLPVTEKIDVELDGKQVNINIELSTKDMHIKPAHLFVDSINLNPNERRIADSDFESFRNAYRLATLEGDITEQMAEVAERGVINIYDLGDNTHSIPNGSTTYDLAYRIGENLGNDAVGVVIYQKTNSEWLADPNASLDTILEEGMKVKFITKAKNTIYPNRYDKVTTRKAITNIQEKTSTQIERWMKRNKKEKDSIINVQTSLAEGKIVPNLAEIVGVNYSTLQSKKEKNLKMSVKEKFVQEARDRGVRIISEIYKNIRGKNLDSHIIDVFSPQMEIEFGSFNDFLVNIGLIPIPVRNGDFLDIHSTNKPTQYRSVEQVENVVNKLVNYRNSQLTTSLTIEDQKGTLKSISEIATSKGVDVQIRSMPDNYSYGRKTLIELRYVEGNSEVVQEIIQELIEKFGEKIIFRIVKQTIED